MSSFFLFAICPAPPGDTTLDELTALVTEQIKNMPPKDLEFVASCVWGDLPSACGLTEDAQSDIDYITEAAVEALTYMLDDPYDAGTWTQNWNTPEAKDYWLTGGISSGDTPTEAYDHIRLLAEIGAWT